MLRFIPPHLTRSRYQEHHWPAEGNDAKSKQDYRSNVWRQLSKQIVSSADREGAIYRSDQWCAWGDLHEVRESREARGATEGATGAEAHERVWGAIPA